MSNWLSNTLLSSFTQSPSGVSKLIHLVHRRTLLPRCCCFRQFDLRWALFERGVVMVEMFDAASNKSVLSYLSGPSATFQSKEKQEEWAEEQTLVLKPWQNIESTKKRSYESDILDMKATSLQTWWWWWGMKYEEGLLMKGSDWTVKGRWWWWVEVCRGGGRPLNDLILNWQEGEREDFKLWQLTCDWLKAGVSGCDCK